MAKLEDGLKILSLQIRLSQAEQLLAETMRMLVACEQDRTLLAEAAATTTEFSDWLMNQDVSSAHMRKPSPTAKGAKVEDADDAALSLAWAAQVYDADGLRRLR